MAAKPVKMGIIGYGHFFRTNFVLNFKKSPDIEIIGVYNRGEERRMQAKEDGYAVTGDLDELLAMPGLEAVAIGTSNSAHREQAIRAVRAGKHVLCEKPLALTLDDINAMVEAAEKAGVVTHVNHPAPYTERFQKIRALVREHAGKVFHCWIRHSRQFGLWNQGARHTAVAHPEESGGWTFHHLCHALDEACILLDCDRAKRVYHMNQVSTSDTPSEEMVNSMVTMANGTTVLLTDGTSIGGFEDMGVQGEGADLRLLGNTITVIKPGPPDPTGRPGNLSRLIKSYPVPEGGKMFETVAEKFAQAVRGGKNELLSFRFVGNQYHILNAMRESAKTGKSVDL